MLVNSLCDGENSAANTSPDDLVWPSWVSGIAHRVTGSLGFLLVEWIGVGAGGVAFSCKLFQGCHLTAAVCAVT